MGKIKRLAFTSMLIAVVSVVAACGRNDNSGTTASSEPYVNDVTTGEYGSTSSSESDSGNGGSNTEETGGILRDMVDDVEQGIDNVTGGTGSGTTSQSGGMSGQ
ncbi:MAG: hypothetical protein E7246_02715 [Lachnoclostridium sp.]|nr:hypothetical protein [Lachnoclostridium sp.]